MKQRLFHVRILFLDAGNKVVCFWEGRLKGLDPAEVTHTGLLKARVDHSSKLWTAARMEVSTREVIRMEVGERERTGELGIAV